VRALRIAAAVAAAVALTLPAVAPAASVDVRVLAFNDFHGNIEAGGSVDTPGGREVDAGGAAYLATHVRRLAARTPGTLVLSTGDLVGASPLVSSLFHDEPTIEAANHLGVDAGTVGNHEFDEGIAELQRLRRGGCHPTDGCQDGTPFRGTDFPLLAANVVRASDGKRIFPAYTILRSRGQRIGVIGTVLQETPSVVTPSGVAGLRFRDEAVATNEAVSALRRRGVRTIVALVHQGGAQAGDDATIDGCDDLEGPIVDISRRMSREVDVVLSAHTHQAYNCRVARRPVISGLSYGRLLTDVVLRVDTVTGQTTRVTARNRIVTRTVKPFAPMRALVRRYQGLAAPIQSRSIGTLAGALTRQESPAGETTLGDAIADAQLAATAAPAQGGAQVAFMNPGGIRADLQAGPVTYGEAFAVQPFGNILTTLTLTGAQIDELLEQQFSGGNAEEPRVLQVSQGFTYRWSKGAAAGQKVDPASIALNGQPIAPTQSVRVVVNNFLADGGDGFAVLTEGTNRLGGAVDVDAFAAYLTARSLLPVPAGGRITVTP
jgi:5'-nucleotidase